MLTKKENTKSKKFIHQCATIETKEREKQENHIFWDPMSTFNTNSITFSASETTGLSMWPNLKIISVFKEWFLSSIQRYELKLQTYEPKSVHWHSPGFPSKEFLCVSSVPMLNLFIYNAPKSEFG